MRNGAAIAKLPDAVARGIVNTKEQREINRHKETARALAKKCRITIGTACARIERRFDDKGGAPYEVLAAHRALMESEWRRVTDGFSACRERR